MHGAGQGHLGAAGGGGQGGLGGGKRALHACASASAWLGGVGWWWVGGWGGEGEGGSGGLECQLQKSAELPCPPPG